MSENRCTELGVVNVCESVNVGMSVVVSFRRIMCSDDVSYGFEVRTTYVMSCLIRVICSDDGRVKKLR